MSSDFLWGTIVGGNIEAANRKTARAVDNLQEAARIREQGEEERRIKESFELGRKKMAELRELLREAHGERDVNAASEENFKLRFQLLESEFKKLHPDSETAEATIQDIKKQGYAREIQFLKDKGYKIAK